MDFGYWQLRNLSLHAEAVSIPPAGDDGSYAMPLRLCEDQDWDDEQSESWEDEDMWFQVVDDDDAEKAPPTTNNLMDGPEPRRYARVFALELVSPRFPPALLWGITLCALPFFF